MFFSEHKKSLTPKEAALMTQLREDTKSKRIAARKSRVSLASFFVTELPVFFSYLAQLTMMFVFRFCSSTVTGKMAFMTYMGETSMAKLSGLGDDR